MKAAFLSQIGIRAWTDFIGWLGRWFTVSSKALRATSRTNEQKMPTRKWKMPGSYILGNKLHNNGLMTDWGLYNTLISLLWILRGRSSPAKTVAHCISVTSTLFFWKVQNDFQGGQALLFPPLHPSKSAKNHSRCGTPYSHYIFLLMYVVYE